MPKNYLDIIFQSIIIRTDKLMLHLTIANKMLQKKVIF